MNIVEILARVYGQGKQFDEAITGHTGFTDQPRRKRRPKSPPSKSQLLRAAEIKRFRATKRQLLAMHKRMEKLARRKEC
jgi:hypothetical protein